YALAGTMDIDLQREPLGSDAECKPVYLADIWPSPEEVADVVQHAVAEEMFTRDYADVFKGDDNWRGLDIPSGDTFAWDEASTYAPSRQYIDEGTPLVVLGGKEYGSGSSRDWAAKGTLLLGVRAVLVESFERIHRSNLIGMGVLPLQYRPGESAASLGLTGEE